MLGRRDVITNVSNYGVSGLVSSYSYDNDALGRRTNRVDDTQALTVTNAFGYNLKSEVTSATMGENAYNYDYDPIGNRIYAAFNAETNTYSANLLNQYSSINPINPVNPVEEITPIYDDDGNMITNGVWSYTWDAENRMVSACSNGVLLITNRYDDQSRRILKSVFEITQSGTNAIRQSSFVYDGWNPVREIRVQGSVVTTKYFCWGPDLSGSLQGAGGVGGLQAIIVDSETPATYYPCYDANGNITAYVDDLGMVCAEFSYDAFGNTITLELSNFSTLELSPFSHRFSTKYADDETGLYYYGYRYYAPELGRWVNRDPISEQGGINVYGFVGNNSYCLVDFLGLESLAFDVYGYPWRRKKGEKIALNGVLNYSITEGNGKISMTLSRKGLDKNKWNNMAKFDPAVFKLVQSLSGFNYPNLPMILNRNKAHYGKAWVDNQDRKHEFDDYGAVLIRVYSGGNELTTTEAPLVSGDWTSTTKNGLLDDVETADVPDATSSTFSVSLTKCDKVKIWFIYADFGPQYSHMIKENNWPYEHNGTVMSAFEIEWKSVEGKFKAKTTEITTKPTSTDFAWEAWQGEPKLSYP